MPALLLLLWPLAALAAPAPLEFYNAAQVPLAELLHDFDPQRVVPLDDWRLNGWGHPALQVTPSPRPGRLAAWHEAAPLGFCRADEAAAVRVRALPPATGGGLLSGVLEPVGLRFRQVLRPDQDGVLTIPIPAPVLPVGDYLLRAVWRVGDQAESLELPLLVGPYRQPERFQTYFWNAGGSHEAELAGQLKLAKMAGCSVLDTAFLPALTALREGFWVSAHYVTLYQGHVTNGYAAQPPYLGMAEQQAEAIGQLARRYPHLRWCLANSEYGSDRLTRAAAEEAALRQSTGLGYGELRLNLDGPPTPPRGLPTVAPGVYADDLPELAAARFARRSGQGWFELNRRSLEILKALAPALTVWTDPVFSIEQFAGFDAVSSWQYDRDPWATVLRTQQAECARRINGARDVYLTLSQWYEGLLRTTPEGPRRDWCLRSPDQHRFESWLTLTTPAQALGYWELSKLPTEPVAAAGLHAALTGVAYPYGTLLLPTRSVAPRVACYVSTTSEFLGRATRPHNFWFATHYLNGVLPALYQRFGGQVEWIDDQDLLAGRLSQYRVVLCPLLTATTPALLAKLAEYQAAGGLLAGDDLWGVPSLVPRLRFPGRTSLARGIPYANEHLATWHAANRADILAWQPPELPAPAELLAVRTASPDLHLALRAGAATRFVVVANGSFEAGDFAAQHGYIDPLYRDRGVAQEAVVEFTAPAGLTAYDVVHSQPVAPAAIQRDGDRWQVRLALPPGGGALLALHEQPIGRLELATGVAGPAPPGTLLHLGLTLRTAAGQPIAGRSAVELTIRDPSGARHDASGCYPLTAGRASLPLGLPLGSPPGEWTFNALDLTSGQQATARCTVR
ncbi:MAG: hypothetical protein IT204_11605 [Fimbriimonadaceae bacterium]|nr:hypothetical protein [Fimbriimonadaceae bacterium]